MRARPPLVVLSLLLGACAGLSVCGRARDSAVSDTAEGDSSSVAVPPGGASSTGAAGGAPGGGSSTSDGAGTGGGAEELLDVSPMPLKAVAVADDWVYYSGRGYVWKIPKAGGEPVQVALWDGIPWLFAVTGTEVCWPNRGDIACVPRGGGDVESISLNGALTEDAVVGTDGTELFMAEPGCRMVARISADHQVLWVKLVADDALGGAGATVGDQNHIYCGVADSLYRLRKTDGEVTEIVSGRVDGGPVAQTADQVFWLEGNRSTSPPQSVYAVTKSDPTAPPRHVADTGTLGGSSSVLHVDEGRGLLYWVRFDTIVSAPVAGGEVREIWKDGTQIAALDMDERYFYWTTTGPIVGGGGLDGRVMKLRRPAQ
jgi:hypothetical protein